MQTKNRYMFLCILVCMGAFFLSSTQVWAADWFGPYYAQLCTDSESENNRCIELYGGYVMRLTVDLDQDEGDDQPATKVSPRFGVPCEEDPINGCNEWEYVISVIEGTDCKAQGVPTGNYLVQKTGTDTAPKILGSDPSGADKDIGGTVPKCTDLVADDLETYWKINPTVVCKYDKKTGHPFQNNVIIRTTADVPSGSCHLTMLTTREGCGDQQGYLEGPGGSTSYVAQRTFTCSEGDEVVVEYDRCSGAPLLVNMDTGITVCPTTVGECDYPQIKEEDPENPGEFLYYTPARFGPGGIGALFCMGPTGEHIYFYNQDAYYGVADDPLGTPGSCSDCTP